MGRWAQARKRGGSALGDGVGQFPAPVQGVDFECAWDGLNVMLSVNGVPPDGVSYWQARWSAEQYGGYVALDPTDQSTFLVVELGAQATTYVQLRWYSGTAPGLPSPWSPPYILDPE